MKKPDEIKQREEQIDQMQREADRTGYRILSIMKPSPDYDSSLKLSPCPFCGCREVVYEEYMHAAGVRWRVVCFGCMASVDPGYAQERHVVAQMWNRRVKNEDA